MVQRIFVNLIKNALKKAKKCELSTKTLKNSKYRKQSLKRILND